MLLDLFFLCWGSFVWGFQASGAGRDRWVFIRVTGRSWLLYEKRFRFCFSLVVSDARPDAGREGLARGGGVSILRLVGRAVQPWVMFELSLSCMCSELVCRWSQGRSKRERPKNHIMTEVGFEPTLSLEKRRFKKILKSSALDHSAIPPLI